MRKVKNCNNPQNKVKSAMFWQKAYRLEWYLIIWYPLNLYVYCIIFIARHFILQKMTEANPISRVCFNRNGTQGLKESRLTIWDYDNYQSAIFRVWVVVQLQKLYCLFIYRMLTYLWNPPCSTLHINIHEHTYLKVREALFTIFVY